MIEIPDIIGLIGVALLISTYALLQFDIINLFMQSQTMCKANIWSEIKPINT